MRLINKFSLTAITIIVLSGIMLHSNAFGGEGNSSVDANEFDGRYAMYSENNDPSAGGLYGQALEISGNSCKYWFYSDIPINSPPKQPISGSASIISRGIIEIKFNDAYASAISGRYVSLRNKSGIFYGIYPIDKLGDKLRIPEVSPIFSSFIYIDSHSSTNSSQIVYRTSIRQAVLDSER